MLKAASRAKISLGDSADLVVKFISEQINEDGGFKDRAGQSDLYYSVFGIESLLALGADVPRDRILSYLTEFGRGQSLDFVHLACLVRCWANLSQGPIEANIRDTIARRLEKHLAEQATIYTCFLALCAYQDLGLELNNRDVFLDCISSLRTKDGAYANESTVEIGSTPATAAALTILHYLNEPVDNSSVDWLLWRLHPKGGFVAMPIAPVPDLLSTATALHALAMIGKSTDDIKEQCLDFIDGLWDGKGGFCGNSADSVADCEYTYYVLLAIGHLS